MEITIYRRHSADCRHKHDRYHPGADARSGFNSTERNLKPFWSGTSSVMDRTIGLPRPASGRKRKRM
jgi:hypothetical protein